MRSTAEPLPHSRWTRARAASNWLNLSTPLGFTVARIGGARVVSRGRGTYLATGYRLPVPVASAFTVGSVIVSSHDLDWLLERPALLAHEDRHSTQYAWCVGVTMVPLYLLAMAVSWLVAGDQSSYNAFERLAKLEDGGYPPVTSRRARRRAVHRQPR